MWAPGSRKPRAGTSESSHSVKVLKRTQRLHWVSSGDRGWTPNAGSPAKEGCGTLRTLPGKVLHVCMYACGGRTGVCVHVEAAQVYAFMWRVILLDSQANKPVSVPPAVIQMCAMPRFIFVLKKQLFPLCITASSEG